MLSPEAGMISPQLGVRGAYEDQINALLGWYERYSNGEVPRLTAESFAGIEAAVSDAVEEWVLYGSRSSSDPVHGATGFIDAPGLCYPSGTCQNNQGHLSEMPDYVAITTNEAGMEAFRTRAYPNSSRVYPIGIDPYSGQRTFTFTFFEPPTYPWP